MLLLLVQANPSAEVPEIRITAPPELHTLQTRLESEDKARLADIVRLAGMQTAGPPISVELALESSAWARRVDPWVAGFAIGAESLLVIFPSRSPSYPHSSLDDVLRHEIAHVLIHRAAGGRAVPRWFNEGLAMTAERQWRFGDQTQLYYQLVSGPRESLDTLNRLFESGQREQKRAYLLSGALVQHLVGTCGEDAPGRILQAMGDGASFETAFLNVTGQTTTRVETEFWNSHRVWTTWIPIVFSDEMLWAAVTLLALLAIQRRRRRNAEIRQRWEEDENEEHGRVQ
jgi:hypothetical protein